MQAIADKVRDCSLTAQTIAVPNLHKPLRLPTYPALERTATLAFTDTSALSVAEASFAAVLLRDPTYPLWVDTAIPSQALSVTGTYQFVGAHGAIKGPDTGALTLQLSEEPDGIGVWHNAPPISFPLPFIRHSGRTYFPLGGNTRGHTPFNFGVELVSSTSSQFAMVLNYSYLMPDGETQEFEKTFEKANSPITNPSCIVDASENAIAIGVRITGVTVVSVGTAINLSTVYFGITTSKPVLGPSGTLLLTGRAQLTTPVASTGIQYRLLPFSKTPEQTQTLLWENVRATATAALFTNVTSVLNKEGTVEAARVPKRTFPLLAPISWDFAAVHPRDRYFGAMEKGFYAYTLADTRSEEFRDAFDLVLVASQPSGLPFTTFNYDSVEYGTIIRFSDIDAASKTILAVTLDRHIEFRTTSRLFPTDYSKFRLEDYHASQMALANMGTMFENPAHLATIGRMAVSAARALWPVIKPYAITAAANLAGKAVAKLDKMSGNMSQAGLSEKKVVQVQRKRKAQKPKRK